jgi:hypothetical protein
MRPEVVLTLVRPIFLRADFVTRCIDLKADVASTRAHG